MELVDLHCHLVPAVDDGAESLETAIETLRSFHASGVRRVVTTPHLDAGRAKSLRRDRIESQYERLAAAATRDVPEVELSLAYEIRIDDPDVDLSDRRLGLSDAAGLLVEFPQLSLPAYSDRMIETVAEQGWTPVLAHPERYSGIANSYRWIERWREMGVVLCLNAGSLLGDHGREAEHVARQMLSLGHADLIASDNHARPHRGTLLRAGWDFLAASGEREAEDVATRLMRDNPRALLDGDALSPVTPFEASGSWWRRLRAWRL